MDRQTILQQLEWRSIGPTAAAASSPWPGDPNKPAPSTSAPPAAASGRRPTAASTGRTSPTASSSAPRSAGSPSATSDPNVIYAGMGESDDPRQRLPRRRRLQVDRRRQDLDAPRAGADAQHRQGPRPPAQPRPASTSPPSATPTARTPSAASTARKDGGKTWDHVLSRGERRRRDRPSLDPNNPRIIFAGFWEARARPALPELAADRAPASGARPTAATPGPTSTTSPACRRGSRARSASPSRRRSPGRVWAIVEHEKGGVFRSDDGGETWERLNEDRNLRQRAWYYSHIFADPQDAEHRLGASTSRCGARSTAARPSSRCRRRTATTTTSGSTRPTRSA